MTASLLLALLMLGANGDRPPISRPKSTAKSVRAAKPQPPPPPPAPEPDPDTADQADDAPQADDDEAPPPSQATQPDEPSVDDEDVKTVLGAGESIIIGSLCCCFLVAIGFGALIYYLVRRKPGAGATAGAPAPPPAAPLVPFHLSVLALGLRSGVQSQVAQALQLAGTSPEPVTAAERSVLVRELATALRSVETSWTHFGYGERLDLPDEAAAARSYQLAVEDFKARSRDGSASGESAHVVSTLVLCTRRQLHGVSALDDRAQIRTMLDDRSRLLETELMGAYWVWSPPLSSAEVLTRFPEMHALN